MKGWRMDRGLGCRTAGLPLRQEVPVCVGMPMLLQATISDTAHSKDHAHLIPALYS